ncbi:uncharacterized protein LOC124613964 isoform X1 [Schistocerca americana]|uniref:uncharacterized protein LOC124613964 isoform X1 n=1 Tax=Schistocerca americana TaxID=7009 RepID=UPI001F5021D2|nr:uncharacterized protein LOC124613964 isoform X1 [Schistocerca americana]XP_046998705.1 uncharacterized protein LOC124613964 isoform X1 [Schistocerca americana]XP_046998706.1 uncharacterized protein LOC124613964 isoform X1 [Schistocerca americana]
MQIRWYKKRITAVSIAAIVLYFIFRSQEHSAIFKIIIRDTKPADVWEYVADFSNMKKLNPTIVDFSILTESGNYDHWKYSAEYKEFLPHAPFIHHSTHAEFEVRQDGESYIINSNHSTCFFKGVACFPATSEFMFSKLGPNTLCVERVTYKCPFLFARMCQKDVDYQRSSVMRNLEKQFTVKKKVKKS